MQQSTNYMHIVGRRSNNYSVLETSCRFIIISLQVFFILNIAVVTVVDESIS